jgi:alcohol dehydrogenase (cytochrome c)
MMLHVQRTLISAMRNLMRPIVGSTFIVVSFASSVAAAQAPGSTAPVGPFTVAQAAHGKDVYERSCAPCHGARLEGAVAPSLAGRTFEARWRLPALTLDDLFYVVRKTMPPKAVGTVSLEDHAAAVAYILEANGYAAGQVPLELGASGLKANFAWAGKYVTDAGDAAVAPVELLPADAGATPGTVGPDQTTLDAATRSTDWLVHTHDYAGTRFSPLDQVNVTNAAHLAPACMFQVGEKDNFQTGPIVHRGTMYLTTARSTIALDAATCRVKWRRPWKLRGDISWNRNQGVAIKDGRLVRGTPDGFLVALSTETGAQLWARRVADPNAGETFTMAPVIYDDLVLIGPAGGELNLKGWVGAFRLSDGSPVWRFNTVPHPGEPGYETWHNPKNIPMGGGAVWTSFSVDTATGDLHVAVANPAPDFPVQLRLGDNLYTNSIVVLDIRTGKLRWYRSLVPNDSHDWDLTHAMPLFTATINGKLRRLVTTAGKDGMLRVLDRDTHATMYTTEVTTIENAAAPVTTTPKRVCPGVVGGVEWSGPSYSAHTGMLYVPAVDWCATYSADAEPRYIPGQVYFGGDVDLDPPEKAQGWVTAIDAATGAVRWKYRSPRPIVASVTTTAGDLVFTGELTGDFLALDARTGAVLYRFNTGGSMGGGIVTYEVSRRQYIAAASGTPSSYWEDMSGGAPTIVVFALPRQDQAN